MLRPLRHWHLLFMVIKLMLNALSAYLQSEVSMGAIRKKGGPIESSSEELWRTFRRKNGEPVDKANLMFHYILLCGGYICDDGSIPFDDHYAISNSASFDCSCKCDFTCFKYKNCCPDVAFGYLEHSCVNTQVYPNNSLPDNSYTFKMVTRCPDKEDEGSKKCGLNMNSVDLFSDVNIPVTSLLTHITYKNKYCARCNEDHFKLDPWNLRTVCSDTGFDFNQLSTVADIWQAIDNNKCILVYQPSSDSEEFVADCEHINDEIISCNVTGLWSEYDPDIDWACQHLHSQYQGIFKNIFCYICNPSMASTYHSEIINRCNMTGDWSSFDPHLRRSCEELPSHYRLKPFKNIFCALCNKNEEIFDIIDRSSFNKGVKFQVYRQNNQEYYVSASNVGAALKNSLKLKTERIAGNKTYPVPAASDLKTALSLYAELCGSNAICDSDLLTRKNITAFNMSVPICGVCSCEPRCVFSKSCCVDFLLFRDPFRCLPLELFPREPLVSSPDITSFRAVKSCLAEETPEVLEHGCASQYSEDIFSYFPATTWTGGEYKNAYCALCNEGESPIDLLAMNINCSGFLEARLFLSLLDLVKVANDNDCQVRFSSYDDCNTHVTDMDMVNVQTKLISKCNVTGTWHENDDVMRQYCELNPSLVSNFPAVNFLGTKYKNVFCFLCNPEKSSPREVISECNITGDWNVYDPEVERACGLYPQHERWHPYKNWFCLSCNIVHSDSNNGSAITITQFSSKSKLVHLALSTKKSIFTLQPTHGLFRKENAVRKTCTNGTLDLISDTCRNIYCPKGRALINGVCKPLIEKTEHLGYELTIGLDLVTSTPEVDVLPVSSLTFDFPKSVIRQITSVLNGSSEIDDLVFYKAFVNESCNSTIDLTSLSSAGADVQPLILLMVNITVEKTSSRSQLEELLVASRQNIYNMTYHNQTIQFQAKSFSKAKIPRVETTNRTQDQSCWTSFPTPNSPSSGFIPLVNFEDRSPAKFYIVSKLLICPMVELESSEYIFLNFTNTILIRGSDKEFSEDEFVEKDNTIRICEKDYKDFVGSKDSLFEQLEIGSLALVHGLFSYVTSTISLLCLLMTFITYSLFQSLRTLPGKNNMCLVFCLFSAQATLQFGILAYDNHIVCITMGILIHFFWLATFCAMSICSYHMYRVFCATSPHVGDAADDRKTFCIYLTFLFLLPLIVIILTISVNLGISKGQNLGYAEYLCFLSNMYSLIGAFIIPASVIFCSNIFFFAKVFKTIRNSPHIQSNQNDKRNTVIYLKLCTIIGLFWPLQIVDGIIGTTVLSFFVSALNDLQGVFIFFSFICNKRVLFLYRQICCKGRDADRSGEVTSKSLSTSDGRTENTRMSSL